MSQCDYDLINNKLDQIIEKLNSMDGIRSFGVNVAANIIGNMIDR